MAEEMNCPNCLKPVAKPDGKIVERDGRRYFSQDRDCPHCSAKLHHSVPIFMVDPYGWRWELLPGQVK
jgi:hypothetical protein